MNGYRQYYRNDDDSNNNNKFSAKRKRKCDECQTFIVSTSTQLYSFHYFRYDGMPVYDAMAQKLVNANYWPIYYSVFLAFDMGIDEYCSIAEMVIFNFATNYGVVFLRWMVFVSMVCCQRKKKKISPLKCLSYQLIDNNLYRNESIVPKGKREKFTKTK